ncbi:MAG: lipoyl(octanoyl) transferase LipB [Dysgonamonadaceae bacterium]|jgi:lipoyl(octanoyl) transferase|nr:lipoyl(octanoyl) transferase LipB [Dysgonamonadaceae bacterium]
MPSGINISDWGLIPYRTAYERQKALFNDAIERKTSRQSVKNTLIICEHPHVITLGKHGKHSNLLLDENRLRETGIECFRTDRGGDVTYHGPGQLVGYPILDLELFNIGLKEYVFRLEETIIKLLDKYSIRGEHLPHASGVWIDIDKPAKVRKICAIGIKSSRYVTMHGFALNVNTDLQYFDLINPCGFTDRGVTSVKKELDVKIRMEDVKMLLAESFHRFFPT